MAANQLATDINVGQKVTGSGKRTKILGLIEIGDSDYVSGAISEADQSQGYGFVPFPIGRQDLSNKAKHAAAYNALNQTGGEVLVAPIYTVKENNFILFQTYEASVTGWSASIDNIRQVKKFNTDNTRTVPEQHVINALKENNFSPTTAQMRVDPNTVTTTSSASLYVGSDVVGRVSSGRKFRVESENKNYLLITFENDSGRKQRAWINKDKTDYSKN